MADLFSIVIPAAITSAASWVTKRLLDAVAGCPRCGREHGRVISNASSNSLVCTSCANGLDQYSLATPTTLRNGHLMGANIFNPHWEREDEGWMFKRHVRNWFLLDVSTVGMQHHGMVIKGSFRDVKSSWVLPATDIYLNNDRERTSHVRTGWYVDPTTMPSYGAVVADVKVQTLDGEVLHTISPIANFTPGGRGY